MFSKSKTKRFQEPSTTGPAPGQYDVKDIKSTTKAVVFERDKRWKKQDADGGICGYSSMENLSGSHSFGKALVPISQSTCMKKQRSNKRKTFVSSSATDLTSRFSREADVEFQSDKIHDLQAKIMLLESEISKLKASASNELPTASLDEILNEKLNTELDKQRLEENLRVLKVEESLRTEELVKTINQLKLVFTSIINGVINKYTSLARTFDNVHNDYQKRLKRAGLLLEKISVTNGKNVAKFEQLEKDYGVLEAEYCVKGNLITEQEKMLLDFTNNISQLVNQIKVKEDSCSHLNVQLTDTNKEKKEKEKVFSVEKEKILNQISGLESIHETALNAISQELLNAHNLNIEYRQQIENVELSMTENIREISRKYECLEETFDKAQKYYQKSLERSNSFVQKTVMAKQKCNEEFENLQKMYTVLQQDFTEVSDECETKENILIEKDKIIHEYENNANSLMCQLAEKDQKIVEYENNAKLLLNQSAEKDKKINEFEINTESILDSLREREQEVSNYEDKSKLIAGQLDKKDEKIAELEHSAKLMLTEMDEKGYEIKGHENDIRLLEEQLKESDERIVEYGTKEKIMLDQLHENDLKLNEYEDNVKSLSDQLAEKDLKIDEYDDNMKLMREKLDDAESSNVDEEELNKLRAIITEAESSREEWRLKYEALERRVGPFMDQLEQFELEKRSLLDQNSLTQQEMKKLSEKYAQILGHQNNKQKIRHISKLKDENFQLKSEVMKLRSNAQKDKIKISQLESRTHDGKRFDPSKSFSHGGKENRDALRSVNS